MRPYQQLTEDDRIDIYAMKQAGKTPRDIARHLGVHPSTISRELARNTGPRGYRPRQAHRRAMERRHRAAKAIKMTPETIAYIEQRLRREHSPEQIAGRMKGTMETSVHQRRIWSTKVGWAREGGAQHVVCRSGRTQ